MDKKSDTIYAGVGNEGYEGALFTEGAITKVFSEDLAEADRDKIIEIVSEKINSFIDAAETEGRSPQVLTMLRNHGSASKELLKSLVKKPVSMLGETDIGLGLPVPLDKAPYSAVSSVIGSLTPDAKGQDLLRKGIHKKDETPVALTMILVVLIAAVWLYNVIAPLSFETKALEGISGQIALRQEDFKKAEALKEEIKTLSSEISVIRDFKEDSTMTLDVLKELTSLIPPNAWFTRVRIDGTKVEINGYAGSATELLPKLESSKYFSKVEFASPTVRDAKMDSDRFRIKMEIEGTGKAEKKG
jgi:Tfp pilus assembly protein PilN